MKKTFLGRGAIIATCAAIFLLGACSQTEFDGRTDTVYSLDAPSVTAKAYPGVNFVSWKPVTGAKEYKVTVYEEGSYKGLLSHVSEYGGYDTDLTNGKKYTYYVEAVSTTNPGTAEREVCAKNSRGEASVTAIVPPAGTKSLELPAYEGGYDGKNTKEVKNDEWVVTADNIKVAVANKNVSINFPMKAYLTYGIKAYKNDLPHELIYTNDDSYGEFKGGLSDNNANNVLGLRSFTITEAGKLQIAVKAFALNDNYSDSDEVIYGEIDIPGLALSAETTDSDIKYTDKKTVRVSFTPAKDAKGADVPTSWYTVYRTEKGKYESTKITDVKTRNVIDGSGAVVAKYYVDDEVGEGLPEKYYTYTIVVSNDGKYGKAEKVELPAKNLGLNPQTSPTSDTAYYILDTNKFLAGADKTVRISFTPAKKDGEYVPTTWYSVYRRADDDLKAEEIKLTGTIKASTDNVNNTKYYIDDTVPDVTKAYTYTVVVTDGELYGNKATLTLDAEEIETLNISVYGNYYYSPDKKATWTVSMNGEKNVTLTAKYLVVSTDRDITKNPVLAQEILDNGKDVTLAKVANSDDYTVDFSASDLTTESAYVYVLVQATKDGYKTANYISNDVAVYK